MPMPWSDIVVLGGGTNGLAAATRLAQAGRSVTLLEAADACGGGALGWEFAPGWRSPGLAHLAHLLDPRVVAGMDLARHGLSLGPPLATVALMAGGPALRIDAAGAAEGPDRAAWAALRRRLMAYAARLAPLRAIAPPRLSRRADNDFATLLGIALGLRRMGAAEFRDFLRLFLINVWDVVEDELSDDRLKGLIAFDATLGAWAGPRSPNTLLMLLNRLAGEVAGQQGAVCFPAGGMAAVAHAMTAAALAAGVTIRTGARAARLLTEGDRVTGVGLASGEQIGARRAVVSALNPVTTLLELLGPRHLDAGMVARLHQVKSRGAAARLNLALSALPDLGPGDARARLVIAPSADAVEAAFNPVKYAEVPDRPVMEILFPSAHGPGFAPPGAHSLSAIVQFAPLAPADAGAARARMLRNSLAEIERHLPGLGRLVQHAELLMPDDIAARFGMPGGNWHHGELSAEQMLFLRPLPALARYAAPVAGLWLAGAGSHPGGGISGAPGWNAAQRMLKTGAA